MPASFSSRFMALAIDLAILGGLFLSILGLAGIRLAHLLPVDLQVIAHGFALFSLFLLSGPHLLSLVYFTIFHAWDGQTIGKMCMGIRVVSAADGSLATGASFLRWVGYLLSALPGGAGFFWSLCDRNRCAWHDRLAGSLVIVAKNDLTRK